MKKVFGPDDPTVEPVRRLVGGRFGWAYHRFPIKGGITPRKASAITWREAITADANKTGFFARLLAKPQTEGSPIRFIQTIKLRKRK